MKSNQLSPNEMLALWENAAKICDKSPALKPLIFPLVVEASGPGGAFLLGYFTGLKGAALNNG